MVKNIIACSDGTGNTAIKGRGTNVFKLFEALDVTSHRIDPDRVPQIAFYDDGVGTQKFKPLKVFAGATGFGLSRNVRELYKQIARIYDPGDNIYLFGFSRGAFTVRSLAGFIAVCGLIDARKFDTESKLENAVRKAYRVYRACYRTSLAATFLGKPTSDKSEELKREIGRADEVRIKFIGVWDTVDAVGLPFHLADIVNTAVYRFKFPDTKLSQIVDHACQALALNDERESFSPVLWNESRDSRIEQVWFAGAHSNVGGGYPKQGMSLVALDWMISAAEKHGLRFNSMDRQFYREHANVDDKLYDPRSGLGIFYRWKIRDVDQLCSKNGVSTPKLHISVIERIAHGTEGYAPGNIPENAKVVSTPFNSSTLLQTRCESSEETLRGIQRNLLRQVRGSIVAGSFSYYIYLISCTAVLFIAAIAASSSSHLRIETVFKDIGHLVYGIITSPLQTAINTARSLWASPKLLTILGVGFLLSYVLALAADRRMDHVFSEFWHRAQPALGAALKGARLKAKGKAAGTHLS